MQHRLLEGCLNPHKHHLWRLPDIPPERQLEPYQDDSRECLVIFPLFQTNDGDVSLEHHIVRSACWAQRSWILFSDAIEKKIKLAFYVGDTVLNRVLPILEKNGIDIDSHVYLLEEKLFEGNPTTHLGKKLSFFNDTQFNEYEWVMQFDADMFLASPTQKKGNFFHAFLSQFEQMPKMPGAVRANLIGGKPPYSNLDRHHWWHVLLHGQDNQKKIDEWLRRARELAENEVVDKYQDETQFITTCHGGIYAFPIKYYQTEKKEDCEWIAKAGQLLQDDEAVFSLWHTRGKPLFCISRAVDIPFCTELANIWQGRENANPTYLSHFATFYHEWVWREDIDAL